MSWAVLFDIDGTLVDSVDLHARAWHEAFAAFGHQVALDRVRMQIGKGGDQLMPVFLSPEEVRHQGKQIERYRADRFASRYRHQVTAFPQVRGLFQRLRADGARLALATSASPEDAAFYQRLLGIEDLVEQATDGDDVEHSKPHPDVVIATLERLQLPATAAIMVGDSPYDMQAATSAGVRAVGVRCGGFPSHTLRSAGAVDLFASPADLLARYDEAFPLQLRKTS